MAKYRIPFNKPSIVGKELYNIAEAVLAGVLSGDGPFTKRCHSWLTSRLGCQTALLTHSCTAALEMAAILTDVGPGDEVIMPSFTFVSTANAFVLRGATPVFTDIREDTLNIDENLIECALTKKSKVIVPVHYAGVPCEMDTICELAKSSGLFVVEDAAQALLSTYKGKYLGTIGDLGALSFHETKNIISGEGGALLVNNSAFTKRAEITREKGTNRSEFFRGEVDKYTWVDIGSSYLPSELVGAFLWGQLEHAEQIIATRQKLCARYTEALGSLEQRGLARLPKSIDSCCSNGHIFFLITSSLEERTDLIKYLKENGIWAVFHYVPLHSSPAGRKFGRTSGNMKLTNSLSERLVRLPLYYSLTEAEVDEISELVLNFYNKR